MYIRTCVCVCVFAYIVYVYVGLYVHTHTLTQFFYIIGTPLTFICIVNCILFHFLSVW